MQDAMLYEASCHCGTVRFSFESERIAKGRRCNCSICIRRGVVYSARYYAPEAFSRVEGTSALTLYQFGDRDVRHWFCKTCGILPFVEVASVPEIGRAHV